MEVEEMIKVGREARSMFPKIRPWVPIVLVILKSIILIGMPGSGKSTVGVLLAKALRRNFVDTDLLIQEETGNGLQDILDHQGISAFLSIEEAAILRWQPAGQVVATGGSVVYSEAAMRHLTRTGLCVYLEVPVSILETRLSNLDSRGVVRQPDQSIHDLWAERDPLYRKWADATIENGHENHEQVVEEIQQALLERNSSNS